jgi:hypothetical protein
MKKSLHWLKLETRFSSPLPCGPCLPSWQLATTVAVADIVELVVVVVVVVQLWKHVTWFVLFFLFCEVIRTHPQQII